MKQEKEEQIKELEKFILLMKALKDESMEKIIDEKYIKYLSLAKKENRPNDNN